MSNVTHKFETDLATDYVPLETWLAEKVGAEQAEKFLALTSPTPEFAVQYDAWLVDQKIIHTIDTEGAESTVRSYKDVLASA